MQEKRLILESNGKQLESEAIQYETFMIFNLSGGSIVLPPHSIKKIKKKKNLYDVKSCKVGTFTRKDIVQ